MTTIRRYGSPLRDTYMSAGANRYKRFSAAENSSG